MGPLTRMREVGSRVVDGIVDVGEVGIGFPTSLFDAVCVLVAVWRGRRVLCIVA